MSDLPTKDLDNADAQMRLSVTSTIADAVERSTALDHVAVETVIRLFADSNERVRGMATYILQTDVDRNPNGSTLPGLRTALSSDRAEIRRGAAFLLAGCLARQEDGAAVATLIDNADPVVRFATLNALANGAVPRAQTDALVAALSKLLDDADVSVRKESIWTLYLLGSEGTSLTLAIAGLERALADTATQGNAAIAIAIAWHAANDGARAEALYDSPTGTVQMGAAWGSADAHLRRGDVAAVKKMFASDNDNVRRGLGALLHHARKQKRDLSAAAQAFEELEKEHPDDVLLHARIYGVTGVTAIAQYGSST